MTHPYLRDARDGALNKLHRLTRNYGAASPDNIPAPSNRLKLNGPEGAIGYGADVDVPRIRADRIARRPMQANPPVFKKGGGVHVAKTGVNALSVKKRAAGGSVVTSGTAKRARGGTLGQALGAAGGGGGGRGGGRKRGGAGGGPKGHTHVNVIVAPQAGGGGGPQNTPLPPVHPAMMGGPGGMPPGLPPPPMAGAGGPPPGMPPGGAGGIPPAALAALMGGGAGGMPPSAIPRPPGAGAMPPPGMPPPGLPMRKKGGGVHDDAAQDERLIKKVLREQGLKRARGGGLHMNKHFGGGSGMGRLEKIGEKGRSA